MADEATLSIVIKSDGDLPADRPITSPVESGIGSPALPSAISPVAGETPGVTITGGTSPQMAFEVAMGHAPTPSTRPLASPFAGSSSSAPDLGALEEPLIETARLIERIEQKMSDLFGGEDRPSPFGDSRQAQVDATNVAPLLRVVEEMERQQRMRPGAVERTEGRMEALPLDGLRKLLDELGKFQFAQATGNSGQPMIVPSPTVAVTPPAPKQFSGGGGIGSVPDGSFVIRKDAAQAIGHQAFDAMGAARVPGAGNQDTVPGWIGGASPALFMPGERIIPPEVVAQRPMAEWEAMNWADRFAKGGFLSNLTRLPQLPFENPTLDPVVRDDLATRARIVGPMAEPYPPGHAPSPRLRRTPERERLQFTRRPAVEDEAIEPATYSELLASFKAAPREATGQSLAHARSLLAAALYRKPEVLQHIPKGSEYIGSGIVGMAFRTPGGDVIRVQSEMAKMIAQARRPDLPESIYKTDRPESPRVLQPIEKHTISGTVLERLPFARTADELIAQGELSRKRAEIASIGLSHKLKQEGLRAADWHAGNWGISGGRFVVIDPGAVRESAYGGLIHFDKGGMSLSPYKNLGSFFKASESRLGKFLPSSIASLEPHEHAGIPRTQMPQVPKEKLDEFVAYLRDRGIDSAIQHVPVMSMVPTQSEIGIDKVIKNMGKSAKKLAGTTVILSQADDTGRHGIIDKHHAWAGMMMRNKDFVARSLVINAPNDVALQATREFPGAFFKPVGKADGGVLYERPGRPYPRTDTNPIPLPIQMGIGATLGAFLGPLGAAGGAALGAVNYFASKLYHGRDSQAVKDYKARELERAQEPTFPSRLFKPVELPHFATGGPFGRLASFAGDTARKVAGSPFVRAVGSDIADIGSTAFQAATKGKDRYGMPLAVGSQLASWLVGPAITTALFGVPTGIPGMSLGIAEAGRALGLGGKKQFAYGGPTSHIHRFADAGPIPPLPDRINAVLQPFRDQLAQPPGSQSPPATPPTALTGGSGPIPVIDARAISVLEQILRGGTVRGGDGAAMMPARQNSRAEQQNAREAQGTRLAQWGQMAAMSGFPSIGGALFAAGAGMASPLGPAGAVLGIVQAVSQAITGGIHTAMSAAATGATGDNPFGFARQAIVGPTGNIPIIGGPLAALMGGGMDIAQGIQSRAERIGGFNPAVAMRLAEMDIIRLQRDMQRANDPNLLRGVDRAFDFEQKIEDFLDKNFDKIVDLMETGLNIAEQVLPLLQLIASAIGILNIDVSGLFSGLVPAWRGVASSCAQIAENTSNQANMTIEPFINQIMQQGNGLGNLQGNQAVPANGAPIAPLFNL